MKSPTLLAVLAALAALTPAGLRAQTLVRIATCSPLSGAQAALGEMIKLGAQIAAEEEAAAFSRAGYRLELAPQDDQASPDVGVAVAKRIVNDPAVLALVGHFNSGVAIPASEVYKDYQLAMVSPANTNPRVTERGYPNVNRVCGRDDVQGPVAAEFAIAQLKASRVFVLNDKTAYGQGVAEAFRDRARALGAAVVGTAGTEEKSNFQSLILQMKVLKPDLVYLGGVYDQGGVLVKQMREKGITATFMGPDGLDSSEFVRIAQQASRGCYYSTVAGPVEHYAAAADFARRFESRFGRKPESFALYAYDAARVAAAAILAAGGPPPARPPREAVCRAIRRTSFRGITGLIEFDARGDRRMADYYIMLLREAAYPGAVSKVISAAPPGR